MRNPLTYVNDKTRLSIYAAFSVIGLGVGGAQVGYASIEAAQPDWLTVALAVYAFVGGAIGFTAATHTGRTEVDATPVPGDYEPRH